MIESFRERRVEYRNSDNTDADSFVGVLCKKNEDIKISFPVGYHFPEDADGRKVGSLDDVMTLIRVIADNPKCRKSELEIEDEKHPSDSMFPMRAYMNIITDFLECGYFREEVYRYEKSRRGKIDWLRTMSSQKKYIQDDGVYFLDFIVKNKRYSENEYITLIHEYCVYDSFEKMGWLYADRISAGKARVKEPRIQFNESFFLSVLRKKLTSLGNDDRNRKLFRSMIDVVSWLGNPESSVVYYYGTNTFHSVWENMVNRVFGVDPKERIAYYPRATWKIEGKTYTPSSLKPDTIMLFGNDIYVLDSKYYGYGVSRKITDTPGAADIDKQITYGEYAYREYVERPGETGRREVYNAFVLPFDSVEYYPDGRGRNPIIRKIGRGVGNWKNSNYKYEEIWVILLDVKYLMNCKGTMVQGEIEKMSKVIRDSDLHGT